MCGSKILFACNNDSSILSVGIEVCHAEELAEFGTDEKERVINLEE